MIVKMNSVTKKPRVICVKVSVLRAGCPCCGKRFETLEEWMKIPEHVYVGRRVVYVNGTFDSPFRNPFAVTKTRSRSQAIAEFEKYLESDPALVARVKEELSGKTLGCWCAPEACHGDVLANMAQCNGL